MSYLIVIILVIFVVLLMLILAAIYKVLNVLSSVHEELKVSEFVIGDVNVSGSGGTADVILRKIWDIEKRMFLLQDIYEKIELIHDLTAMSPEEKEKIFEMRRLAAGLKGEN